MKRDLFNHKGLFLNAVPLDAPADTLTTGVDYTDHATTMAIIENERQECKARLYSNIPIDPTEPTVPILPPSITVPDEPYIQPPIDPGVIEPPYEPLPPIYYEEIYEPLPPIQQPDTPVELPYEPIYEQPYQPPIDTQTPINQPIDTAIVPVTSGKSNITMTLLIIAAIAGIFLVMKNRKK